MPAFAGYHFCRLDVIFAVSLHPNDSASSALPGLCPAPTEGEVEAGE
jgi:hypothetical protein